MATYSQPYKHGTIAAVSGDVITVNGATRSGTVLGPSGDDVDRALIITSGPGKFQWRPIRAVNVTARQYTLEHSFDTSPIPGFTDVNPAVGTTYSVAYKLQEIAATDQHIQYTPTSLPDFFRFTSGAPGSAHILTNNTYIQFDHDNVIFNSGNVELRDGGWIVGSYRYVPGEIAIPTEKSILFDLYDGLREEQMRGGIDPNGLFGMLNCWGANIYKANGHDGFWRLYRNASQAADCETRFVDCSIQGGFGARVDGNRSFLQFKISDCDSNIGPVNPRGSVGSASTLPAIDVECVTSEQANYAWLAESTASTMILRRIRDITRRIFRINALRSPGASTGTFRIIAKVNEIKASELAGVPLARIENVSTTNHASGSRINVEHLFEPTFIDSLNAPITEQVKCVAHNNQGQRIINLSTTTGAFPPGHRLVHSEMPTTVGTSSAQTIFFSDIPGNEITGRTSGSHRGNAIKRAPYAMGGMSYNHIIVQKRVEVEDSLKYDESLTLLPQPLVTNSNRLQVNGYTRAENSRKLYDYIRAQLFHNYNGEDETATLLTREGDTIRTTSAITGDTASQTFGVYFAQDYDQTLEYAIGDVVVQGNFFHRLAQSTVPGPFDTSKWARLFPNAPQARPVEVSTTESAGVETIQMYVATGRRFTGNIDITGTVSAAVDLHEIIDGFVLDSVANSELQFFGIDSWRLWLSEADQIANATPVAQGDHNTRYRFNFVENTTFYLELAHGTARVRDTFVPQRQGVSRFDVTTAAAIVALDEQVMALSASVGSLATGVEEIRTQVRPDNDQEILFTPAQNPGDTHAVGIRFEGTGGTSYGVLNQGSNLIRVFADNFTINEIILRNIPRSQSALFIQSDSFDGRFTGLGELYQDWLDAEIEVQIINSDTVTASTTIQAFAATGDTLNKRIGWAGLAEAVSGPTIHQDTRVRIIFRNVIRRPLSADIEDIKKEVEINQETLTRIEGRTPDHKLDSNSDGEVTINRNQETNLITQ